MQLRFRIPGLLVATTLAGLFVASALLVYNQQKLTTRQNSLADSRNRVWRKESMLRLLAWLDLEDPNQRHLMNLVLENAQTLQQDFSEQLWPERPVTSIGFRDCPMRK